MEELFTNVIVKNSYFLDHDAVRVVIEKNYVDFYINPQNLIQPGKKRRNDCFPRFLSHFNYLTV